MSGVDLNDAAGRSVDWIGDFNDDGFDDFIVGAFRVDGPVGGDAGAAYVVFGDPDRFDTEISLGDLDGSDGFRLVGRNGGDTLGERVSGLGDINDDGLPDVAVGAYRADPGGKSGAGEAYVLFGSDGVFPASIHPDDLDGDNGFELLGANPFDQLGFDVSGAGDVNGDGIDDLIVGGDGANSAWVVFGRSTAFPAALSVADLDGANGFRLDGAASGADTGHTVAGIGDFDGDGVDDIAVSAPAQSPDGMSNAGAVFVLFGSLQPFPAAIDLAALDGLDGFRIDGQSAGAELGHAVSGVGDFNADGLSDFAFSSLGYDAPAAGGNNAGIVYLVLGGSAQGQPAFDLASLDGSNGGVLIGVWADGNLGRAVAPAGDFDKDGLPDWLTAADRANPEARFDAGEVAVVYGTTDPLPASRSVDALDGEAGIVVIGATAGERTGFDLAGGGDLDGDGEIDLLFGAPFADPGGVANSGRVIVLSGRGLVPIFSDRFEAPAP
ncbi:MAG: hypothetical protein GVY32_09735 [Gammaproteobacteria bacterium]|jgi:glycosylphosphatidylinositol phospholipase D|nr:hypothetical protein [Gammaproteobacteria bacterium]